MDIEGGGEGSYPNVHIGFKLVHKYGKGSIIPKKKLSKWFINGPKDSVILASINIKYLFLQTESLNKLTPI